MCTVSYLPVEEGFILTSNRDERISRKAALAPQKHLVSGTVVCFPQDPEAMGTWIAATPEGRTACLLNGAYEKHTTQPTYRHSRGRVVLDYFTFQDGQEFLTHYEFNGIEPFTLLLVEPGERLSLVEIRWDGKAVHFSRKDADKPEIWSSVTLYSKEVIRQREIWFQQWLEKNPANTSILDFHRFAGTGDKENDLVMERPDRKQTVSITSIRFVSTEKEMVYADLLSGQTMHIALQEPRLPSPSKPTYKHREYGNTMG